LNQVNRLLGQMVLPNHASDLDLLDRAQTRRRLQSQAGIANQLPSHSDGNFHQPLRKSIAGTEACASHAQPFQRGKRSGNACVQRINRKKINVKRVNC
jgi:hypothetical protein